MEIKASDTYRCELTGGLSFESMVSLMELYQPLISAQAAVVYMTLAAEASSLRTQQSHSRLFALCGIDPLTFDRAMAKLEEYMLVRIYRKESENRSNYIYVLNPPMSAKSFTNSAIFMNRYMNAMGSKQMETT